MLAHVSAVVGLLPILEQSDDGRRILVELVTGLQHGSIDEAAVGPGVAQLGTERVVQRTAGTLDIVVEDAGCASRFGGSVLDGAGLSG